MWKGEGVYYSLLRCIEYISERGHVEILVFSSGLVCSYSVQNGRRIGSHRLMSMEQLSEVLHRCQMLKMPLLTDRVISSGATLEETTRFDADQALRSSSLWKRGPSQPEVDERGAWFE